MTISETVIQRLQNEFYSGEEERVGFVLSDNEIVEVQNVSDDKLNGFDISGEDIIQYMSVAIASWHTHPNETSNLSVGDFDSFKDWPNMRHLIIGTDGVTEYYVEDGEVLIA